MEPLTAFFLLSFLFAGATAGVAVLLVGWDRFKTFVTTCVERTITALGHFVAQASDLIRRVVAYVTREGDYALIEVSQQLYNDPHRVYTNIQKVPLHEVPRTSGIA